MLSKLLNAFFPDDSSIIHGTENVQELISRVVNHLHGPAATIPAEGREVIHNVVKAAIVLEHVPEHIAQVDFWPEVLIEVTERILGHRVNVFIEFLDVVLSEAFWIDSDLVISVKATIVACKEPVSLIEPKVDLSGIDQVWNIIIELMNVIRVLLVFE